MGQPMFGVLKRETVQKILSLMVLLLFHYEPIPNQPGQMQMHKSPLLFLRLNNSVRISVQTNMVWLRTPSGPSAVSFKVTVRASRRVCNCGLHAPRPRVTARPLPQLRHHQFLETACYKALCSFTREKFTFYQCSSKSRTGLPMSLEGLLSFWARNWSSDMMKGNTKKCLETHCIHTTRHFTLLPGLERGVSFKHGTKSF